MPRSTSHPHPPGPTPPPPNLLLSAERRPKATPTKGTHIAGNVAPAKYVKNTVAMAG
jgi:hypothetical protein